MFWTTSTLSLPVEYHILYDGPKKTETEPVVLFPRRLSNLEMMIQIYTCAIDLEDEALKECLLNTMRLYVKRDNLDLEDLARATDWAYRQDNMNSSYFVIRRILLSGMVLNRYSFGFDLSGFFRRLSIQDLDLLNDLQTGFSAMLLSLWTWI